MPAPTLPLPLLSQALAKMKLSAEPSMPWLVLSCAEQLEIEEPALMKNLATAFSRLVQLWMELPLPTANPSP